MDKLFVVENTKTKTANVFNSPEKVSVFMLGKFKNDYTILICRVDKVITNIPSEVTEIRELLYRN